MPFRPDFRGSPNERGKRQARQALARGQAAGHAWMAVYLPGEEVRCPGLPTEPDVCGGFLFVRGCSGPVHVRVVMDDRSGDRRATPRAEDRPRQGDTHRCPRHDNHRLEVEGHQSASLSA